MRMSFSIMAKLAARGYKNGHVIGISHHRCGACAASYSYTRQLEFQKAKEWEETQSKEGHTHRTPLPHSAANWFGSVLMAIDLN